MAYATLMVHLQPGRTNARPLRAAAADLADRFQAAVTGVAACCCTSTGARCCPIDPAPLTPPRSRRA